MRIMWVTRVTPAAGGRGAGPAPREGPTVAPLRIAEGLRPLPAFGDFPAAAVRHRLRLRSPPLEHPGGDVALVLYEAVHQHLARRAARLGNFLNTLWEGPAGRPQKGAG